MPLIKGGSFISVLSNVFSSDLPRLLFFVTASPVVLQMTWNTMVGS